MYKLSGKQLRDKFISGELSAIEITQYFLNRIEKHEPKIDAFLSVFNERALKKAAALDQKRAAGRPLGKLAAIPIAIKDNIHIQDEISTCGSRFLSNYRAPFSATATHLLEEEDAILIGKTNMDEFAMGSSCENSAFKNSRNPWDLKCAPGGSSGGSAAAVSARLCPIALGTDTGGSIRQPASLCGITGFKPTYGCVSRYGLVAYGSSLDQIGPMTTCTEDAALMMEVMGQPCANDSTSIELSNRNFTTGFNQNIKGLKIGVPWQFLEGQTPEARAIFQNSMSTFTELGATIKEIDLSLLKYAIATYYIVATAEASTNLARFDGVRYGQRSERAQTLDEVYTFSKEEGFGPEVKRRILLGTYVLSSGYREAFYTKAQKVRTLMIQQFSEAFSQCDIIAIPVTPFTAFELGSIRDPLKMYRSDTYTIGANLCGLPAISIPAGFSEEGKPVGLQLIGPQKYDAEVIRVANTFEQATDHYKRTPELDT